MADTLRRMLEIDLFCTSLVEHNNLTMRMRRFIWLTKIGNHAHAIALHLMHSNFARIYQTLKSTPATRATVKKCRVT